MDVPTNRIECNQSQSTSFKKFASWLSLFIARNPIKVILFTIFVSLVVSVFSVISGGLNIDMLNRGWSSRGTHIGERAMQASIFEKYKIDLFNDESGDFWQYVTNTTLEGYIPIELVIENEPALSNKGVRNDNAVMGELSVNASKSLECEHEWYTSEAPGLRGDNLNAIWKSSMNKSALDPDVLFEICKAEEAIIRLMEQNDVCSSCIHGRCLRPLSLVTVVQGFLDGDTIDMNCEDFLNAYRDNYAAFEMTISKCVEDIIKRKFYSHSQENTTIYDDSQCPPYFREFMLDFPLVAGDKFDIAFTTSSFPIPGVSEAKKKLLFELRQQFPLTDPTIVDGRYEMNNNVFIRFYLSKILLHELTFALASILMTILAVILHTKSLWLTLFGLLQIILAVPWAFFVYRFFVGLSFFPILNLTGIFLSAALGADDLFVACDKWKNSRLQNPKGTTEEVAIKTLPDAAGAMQLTTATTAVAFIGTVFCPVAPIFCFAVFCSLVVMFNYVFNCLLVFPALCMYDRWLQENNRNCLIAFSLVKSPQLQEDQIDQYVDDPIESIDSDRRNDINDDASLIHRFLFRVYDFIRKFGWPLLVLFLAATCLSTIYGYQMPQPESNFVRLLPPSNEYEQFNAWSQRLLSYQILYSEGASIDFYWGIVPGDTGDKWNPDISSKLILDDDFDPSTSEAQLYLLNFCDRLFLNDFAKRPDSGYQCTMNRFDEWLRKQSSLSLEKQAPNFISQCNGERSLPISQEYFHPCISYYSKYESDTMILTNPLTNKAQIIQFKVRSNTFINSNMTVLESEYSKYEQFCKAEAANVPIGVNKFYHSSMLWWWFDTVAQMQQAAMKAAVFAIGVSAALVLLMSRSIHLTMFSAVCILFVLSGTAATLIVILSWTLGFLESICFAILIGISCDFVIHLGHSYSRIPGVVNRRERTKNALLHMGPSILASAFTTCSSALFMLLCEMTFFPMFATILLLTIIFAVIGSMVFYTVLTDLFGPSEPRKGFDSITQCLRRRKITYK